MEGIKNLITKNQKSLQDISINIFCCCSEWLEYFENVFLENKKLKLIRLEIIFEKKKLLIPESIQKINTMFRKNLNYSM